MKSAVFVFCVLVALGISLNASANTAVAVDRRTGRTWTAPISKDEVPRSSFGFLFTWEQAQAECYSNAGFELPDAAELADAIANGLLSSFPEIEKLLKRDNWPLYGDIQFWSSDDSTFLKFPKGTWFLTIFKWGAFWHPDTFGTPFIPSKTLHRQTVGFKGKPGTTEVSNQAYVICVQRK